MLRILHAHSFVKWTVRCEEMYLQLVCELEDVEFHVRLLLVTRVVGTMVSKHPFVFLLRDTFTWGQLGVKTFLIL